MEEVDHLRAAAGEAIGDRAWLPSGTIRLVERPSQGLAVALHGPRTGRTLSE